MNYAKALDFIDEISLRALNAITARSHFEKISDLPYGPAERHRMDLFLPVATDKSIPTPSGICVVFIHGGGWRTGSKKDYAFVGSSLTKAGHTVLLPNYQLYPEASFPAFVTDAALAIAAYEKLELQQYTKQDGATKPLKLVLMGHSSGAHSAAMLATDPSYLTMAGVASEIVGLVGISGPYDLSLENKESVGVFPANSDEIAVKTTLQAQHLGDARQHASMPLPPTLLLHGAADKRVGITHSKVFTEALHAAGASVTMETLRGGHATAVVSLAGPLRFLNNSLNAVKNFLSTLTK